MCRITLSRKTMECTCHILKEASNDNKNSVRRRTEDQMSEYYGTRKYNLHGRYLSFLSLEGVAIEVILFLNLSLMRDGET